MYAKRGGEMSFIYWTTAAIGRVQKKVWKGKADVWQFLRSYVWKNDGIDWKIRKQVSPEDRAITAPGLAWVLTTPVSSPGAARSSGRPADSRACARTPGSARGRRGPPCLPGKQLFLGNSSWPVERRHSLHRDPWLTVTAGEQFTDTNSISSGNYYAKTFILITWALKLFSEKEE